ncbi:oxidized low-density lipoprotein receptor 1 isoform X3 [Choloepus didactylus]|uniref:oxidized low-density lipoprotein receptor 1 isoform X3 n=1 Tax=Choloepus didactylus TaxID=27675 RepID=UPI00189E3453|nr:oxidized low-density lipoprotein receptor 1 isoform X3 [Choloepus didactylus]
MNLEMMCDDFKMKTMKDQPDQKLNGEKSKGCHLLSRFWRPAAVILGIICLALLTTTVLLGVQLSQVSALLKQQQGNLTRQEHVPEGQMSAQRQVEGASQESLKELNEMIEFLAQKLEESSRKQMELHHQNLNLQEALKKAANFSGIHPASQCPFQFPVLDGIVSEETQQLMALGGWFSLDVQLVSF